METGELACEKRATRPKGQNNAHAAQRPRARNACMDQATTPLALCDRSRRAEGAAISAAAPYAHHQAQVEHRRARRQARDSQGHPAHAGVGRNPARRSVRGRSQPRDSRRSSVQVRRQGQAASPTAESWRRSSARRRSNACRWKFPTYRSRRHRSSTSTTSSTFRR